MLRSNTVLAVRGISYIVLAIILLFSKPYRHEAHNKTDIFFLLVSAIGCSAVFASEYESKQDTYRIIHHLLYIIFVCPAIIIPLYGIYMVTRQVLPKRLFTFAKECYQHATHVRKRPELAESFLYRYESDEHSPLLRQ